MSEHPEDVMNSLEMAKALMSYFNENQWPMLQASGVPDEELGRMRFRYVQEVAVNPFALWAIAKWYFMEDNHCVD